jgi:hypothetical protein
MSKRLQVIVDDEEYRRFEQAATSEGFTMSEWVRRILRGAERGQPEDSIEGRLATIRAAHALQVVPSPDIEQMNAEIEQGYLGR